MPRFIKLETWAQQQYGDDKPDMRTLRRWAANGNLYPPAEQHGKCWYVSPDAKYKTKSSGSLIDRMKAEYGAQAA